MKKQPKKLNLAVETLRRLDALELVRIAGGAFPVTPACHTWFNTNCLTTGTY